MKRLSTIIRSIIESEKELYCYNDEEIKEAVDKYERENGTTGSMLISTIYEGLEVEEKEES